jgi:hypothetical protein
MKRKTPLKLSNTSASQVTAWDSCQRFWHYNWVKGLKAPPTIAMQRGTHIHSAAEHALKNQGELLDNDWKPYGQAMLPHLPIGQEKILVEKKIELVTRPELPPWIGFIDLLDDSRTVSQFLRVTDHKTTSDFRYAKTPAELMLNSQLNSYARWVFETGHDEDEIEVGHLYIKTAKKTPKSPKVKPVYVRVTRKHVNTVWERDLVKVEAMTQAAVIDDTNELPPSPNFCSAYGGCPHRARCGLINETLYSSGKGNSAVMSDFLKNLQAKKAAKAAPTVPTGVLSEDSTERTTPAETQAEAPVETEGEAPKKKRGRPAGSKNKKTTTTAVPQKERGFTLYINCMPAKDVGNPVEPTLFEDWYGTLTMSMNETVAEKQNLPHYMLLPFAENKAMIALAVSESVEKLPPAMVVDSASPGAKDALAVLIPHATTVVRAIRG